MPVFYYRPVREIPESGPYENIKTVLKNPSYLFNFDVFYNDLYIILVNTMAHSSDVTMLLSEISLRSGFTIKK